MITTNVETCNHACTDLLMNSNGVDGGLMGAEALPKKDKGGPMASRW